MTIDTKCSHLLQYVAAFTGSLAVVTDGMIYGWPSPSIPQLTNRTTCTFCIDENQSSNIAVLPLLAAILGSLAVATIVDIFGRKITILATAIPYFVSWILVAFGQDILLLYIARLVGGLASGAAFAAVAIYIAEISDSKIRGTLGSSCAVALNAGALMINVLGSFFSVKTTALLSSILPTVFFFTFMWMPESPYFLLMKNREEDARKSVERLKGSKEVDSDLKEIRSALEEEEQMHATKFVAMFTVKSTRKAVLIVGCLRGFQQLAGMTAIAFYTHEIFQAAGTHISTYHSVMIYYSIQLLLTILSSNFVDRFGRRPLLLISMSGSLVVLLVEGTYFYILNETSVDTSHVSVIGIVGLLVFISIFSLGMGPIPECMVGELFPTNVKGLAVFLSDVVVNVAGAIASKFLQMTKDAFGLHVSFFGFAICAALGLVFIYFCVPETKGKTLRDIQKDLKKSCEQR